MYAARRIARRILAAIRLLLLLLLVASTCQPARAQIGPLKPRALEPLTGTVADVDGNPVPDAEVLALRRNTEQSFAEIIVISRTRTNQRGEFNIALEGDVRAKLVGSEEFSVWFVALRQGSSPGGAELRSLESAQSQRVRIVLHPPGTTTIRVLDPDGHPIAGARVLSKGIARDPDVGLGFLALPLELRDRFSADTDAQGTAVLTAGALSRIKSFDIVASGFGTQTVNFADQSDTGRTVTLSPVGRMVARIVSDDRMALAGIRMTALAFPPVSDGRPTTGFVEMTSDATGRFPPAELTAGRLMLSMQPSATSPFFALRPPGTALVVAGKTMDVEIRVKRGIRVRGCVREKASGRPVAGVTVMLQTNPDAGSVSVRTDSEGQYRTFLLPGTVRPRITDSAPFHLPAGIEPPTAVLVDGAAELEIPPFELVRDRNLQGMVVTESQNPVADAVVQAAWFDRNAAMSSVRHKSVKTNQQGEYRFLDLPSDVEIWLTAAVGEMCSKAPALVGTAGGSTKLVVSREFTRSITGRVVDERGQPVAGAEVWVASRSQVPEGRNLAAEFGFRGDQEDWHLRTDADGRFETPRRIRHDVQVRGFARAPGKDRGRSVWVAPTSPSVFDIVLNPTLPREQTTIRAALNAAESAMSRGNLVEAEKQLQTAVDETERLHVDDPVALARRLEKLAEVKMDLGKALDADIVAQRSLALLEKELGPNHPGTASILSLLGFILDHEERFDFAETHHKRSIAIRTKSLDNDHPDLALSRVRVAIHYITCREYEVAEAILRRVLETNEKVLGPDAWPVAYNLVHLARAETALKKYELDEPHYKRALLLCEKWLGPEHPFVAYVLECYVYSLRKTDREAEAEPLEARAKRIHEKSDQRNSR